MFHCVGQTKRSVLTLQKQRRGVNQRGVLQGSGGGLSVLQRVGDVTVGQLPDMRYDRGGTQIGIIAQGVRSRAPDRRMPGQIDGIAELCCGRIRHQG